MKKLKQSLLLLIIFLFVTSCSDMLSNLNKSSVPTPQIPIIIGETTEPESEP